MSSRIVVTGAARGIGAATVAELRRRGARVVGLDLREGEDILECDVRDQDSVDRAVAAATERLGGLDVVVNNAGIGTPQTTATRPDPGAAAVIDVNLLGPWRVTAAALPALRESRGRVVNVASGLAFLSVPFAVAYCMSKRALVVYSDALRLEHGDAITVTTVYPGYVPTSIHEESTAAGVGIEGSVPPERVEDTARAVARAALGRPVRDLATTRRGSLTYPLLSALPRRLVDRAVAARMRKRALGGEYDATGIATEFVAAQRARERSR